MRHAHRTSVRPWTLASAALVLAACGQTGHTGGPAALATAAAPPPVSKIFSYHKRSASGTVEGDLTIEVKLVSGAPGSTSSASIFTTITTTLPRHHETNSYNTVTTAAGVTPGQSHGRMAMYPLDPQVQPGGVQTVTLSGSGATASASGWCGTADVYVVFNSGFSYAPPFTDLIPDIHETVTLCDANASAPPAPTPTPVPTPTPTPTPTPSPTPAPSPDPYARATLKASLKAVAGGGVVSFKLQNGPVDARLDGTYTLRQYWACDTDDNRKPFLTQTFGPVADYTSAPVRNADAGTYLEYTVRATDPSGMVRKTFTGKTCFAE